MKGVNPYLNFPGNTEAAFEFYRSVFGGEFLLRVRFRDFGDNPMGVPEVDLDKLAHISLPVGPGQVLMGTDALGCVPATLKMGNNSYISIASDSAGEARRLFAGLSEGGQVQMPLQRTEWAELYGSLVDPFGVQWMIDFTGDVSFRMQTPGHP